MFRLVCQSMSALSCHSFTVVWLLWHYPVKALAQMERLLRRAYFGQTLVSAIVRPCWTLIHMLTMPNLKVYIISRRKSVVNHKVYESTPSNRNIPIYLFHVFIVIKIDPAMSRKNLPSCWNSDLMFLSYTYCAFYNKLLIIWCWLFLVTHILKYCQSV